MKVLFSHSDDSIQILDRETGSTVINGKYIIDLPPGTSSTPDEILSLGIDTVIGNKLIELNPEFNAQDPMIIDGVVVNIPRSSADSWLLTANTEIDNSDSFGKTEEEYVLYELANYHILLKTRYQSPSTVPTVNTTILSEWIEHRQAIFLNPAPGMIITDDIDFSTIPGMGAKSVPEELMIYWSIQRISTTDDTPPSWVSRGNIPVYKNSTSMFSSTEYIGPRLIFTTGQTLRVARPGGVDETFSIPAGEYTLNDFMVMLNNDAPGGLSISYPPGGKIEFDVPALSLATISSELLLKLGFDTSPMAVHAGGELAPNPPILFSPVEDDIYVYMSTDSGSTYSRVRSLEPITLNAPMFMEPFTMRLVFINLNPYKVCLSHFAFLYSVEQLP